MLCLAKNSAGTASLHMPLCAISHQPTTHDAGLSHARSASRHLLLRLMGLCCRYAREQHSSKDQIRGKEEEVISMERLAEELRRQEAQV